MTLITRVILPSVTFVVGDSQINDSDHKPISKDREGNQIHTDKLFSINNIVIGITGSLGVGEASQKGYVRFSNIDAIKQYIKTGSSSNEQIISEISKDIVSGKINFEGDLVLLFSYTEKEAVENITVHIRNKNGHTYEPVKMNSVSLSSSKRITQFYGVAFDYKSFVANFEKSELLSDVEFNFNCLQHCNWYDDPNRHRPDVLYTILFLVMEFNGYESLRLLNEDQMIQLLKDFYKALNVISWQVFENGDPQLRTIGECAFIYKLDKNGISMPHNAPCYVAKDLPYFRIP